MAYFVSDVTIIFRMAYVTGVAWVLSVTLLVGGSRLTNTAMDMSSKHYDKVLHIGGIFPINGTSGWQGGQVQTI